MLRLEKIKFKNVRYSMKSIRKVLTVAVIFTFVFSCVTTAQAYNTKFSFDITPGMLSPWGYSSYATKFTKNESPVVKCTYTGGKTKRFMYTVRNSNNQDKVSPITRTGTFSTTAFKGNQTTQNYMYKLGAMSMDGASSSWLSGTRTEGQWNIDSY
jgi:hypothetical protein